VQIKSEKTFGMTMFFFEWLREREKEREREREARRQVAMKSTKRVGKKIEGKRREERYKNRGANFRLHENKRIQRRATEESGLVGNRLNDDHADNATSW